VALPHPHQAGRLNALMEPIAHNPV
jgi:hypothetical protein